MRKHISILGSTGSIGTQALEVISKHPGKFVLDAITANENIDLLAKQAIQFLPSFVVIGNEAKYKELKNRLQDHPVEALAGQQAINDIVKLSSTQIVLTAMVGYAGLEPTINAIQSGKDIALANKETLVVAGELITQLACKNNVHICPVDSEHSAIFQCLAGEKLNAIEKIILTASGGPFRGQSMDFLKGVTKHDALKHPNWCMGNKITIDSASLMNKGLEVIEAKWLFNLRTEQIDVVIHPQSIIHSMVQFVDGSIKAQMGLPDMRLPILYALGYPDRIHSDFERFNFSKYPNLTFEQPDFKVFRNLQLAFDALDKGGNMPCILNAANEVAVEAFLADKITFLQMPDIIEKTLQKISYIESPDFEAYKSSNEEARKYAYTIIR